MTPEQEKAKQQAEVMLAFAEGKEIEASFNGIGSWTYCIDPTWNWPTFQYRIKKPEPKKVKLLAYITTLGMLVHIKEGSVTPFDAIPIPKLDLETEIEE